jgi:predicted nuclease of restriction endonuclease-like (RecB) superfamily
VIERLAHDLQQAFPGVKGFSARNIWRMRAFYLAYTQQVQELSNRVAELDGQNLPQAVAEIPWGHNVLLLEKVKDVQARLWYIHKTLEHGWSRSVLWHHIDTKLYNRQFQPSRAANFQLTLPPAQSDLVREVLKDPYNFDFLTLADDAQEKDLERGLLEHIREFLLELGVGFAFVGNQYHLKVGDEDFYIDLLFYHFRLRCFVVIDLKMKEFKPEFSGKMNFYVSAVDDLLRHPDDQPSIGIILCKTKNQTLVEYALRDVNKPIGVSTYQLRDALPEQLQGSLPTIEQLEAELEAVSVEIDEEE